MNNYTEEEINSFIYPMVIYHQETTGTAYIRLTLNLKVVFVRAGIVMKILKDGNYRDFIFSSFQKDFYQTDVGAYYNILSMLHKVSFVMLPLFINSYPEIASWRLKIGK
jgi:hypothetical protein